MVKILLMRHAQSEFNIKMNTMIESFKTDELLHLTIPEQESLKKEIRFTPGGYNASITSNGRLQCQTAGATLSLHPKIKRVFLSPLNRTIQTFEESMQNHPNFLSNNIKITFLPELRECTWSNCDLANIDENTIKMSKNFKFPELYDWSFLKNYKDPKFWYLETGDKKHIDYMRSLVGGIDGEEKKLEALCGEMMRIFPRQLESNDSLWEGSRKAGEMIREAIREEGLEDEEVLVVAHLVRLGYLTTSVFDEEDGKVPRVGFCKDFKNCEVVSFDF